MTMTGQNILDAALLTKEDVEQAALNKLIKEANKPEPEPPPAPPKPKPPTDVDMIRRRVLDTAMGKHCPILTRGGGCLGYSCVAFELKETRAKISVKCNASALNVIIYELDLPKPEGDGK